MFQKFLGSLIFAHFTAENHIVLALTATIAVAGIASNAGIRNYIVAGHSIPIYSVYPYVVSFARLQVLMDSLLNLLSSVGQAGQKGIKDEPGRVCRVS